LPRGCENRGAVGGHLLECISNFADQFNNVDVIVGYRPLAEEAWKQSAGRIDVFVHSVGTVYSIAGVKIDKVDYFEVTVHHTYDVW